MKTLRTAVIGVGYLGNFHADKYDQLPQCELVAVCDCDQARCDEIAARYKTQALMDYRQLIGKVDAVSIVTTTTEHYDIGLFFLQHGVHVLMEKPITSTIAEADQLIAAAKQSNVLLQVGHLERFNNAIRALDAIIVDPRFIECTRLSPFKIRGSEVNVILDLMIHDIDIIQSLVKSDITHISATGAAVLSPYIDIANARLEFANGCVANVTASRVNLKMERKLHIFQSESYLSLDLNEKTLAIHRKGEREMFPGVPRISRKKQRFDKGDALLEQITAFVDSIIHNKPVLVSGEDGKNALALATEITRIVREKNARQTQEKI